jgi:hypothetical protein
MSSAESPLSARQTLGKRIGRKRGATVEEKAKAICFQRRRDITVVEAQMQHEGCQMAPKSTLGARGLNTLVTLTHPQALVTFRL